MILPGCPLYLSLLPKKTRKHLLVRHGVQGALDVLWDPVEISEDKTWKVNLHKAVNYLNTGSKTQGI